MKTLEPISAGGCSFAEHTGGSVVSVTLILGRDRLARNLNHQGAHDHSDAQFEKDVNDFAARLATELARRIRSTELARKFTQS